MIKHIVLWKLKGNPVDKENSASKMKEKIESMQGKINGLISIQVGINKNEGPDSWDVCLISEHTTWNDLQFYQDHPLHKEVGAFISQIREVRSVVDFEF